MFALGHVCVCASADPLLVFRLVRRSNTPARSAKRKRNLEGGENMPFKCHLSLRGASKASKGLAEFTRCVTAHDFAVDSVRTH